MERVKVVIENVNRQEITVSDTEKTILDAIGEAGTDWMQVCGRKGRCTTCAFQVLEGEEFLSAATGAEERYRAGGRLADGYRLACQTRIVSGTVVIRVPNALKLPHISYTD